MAEIVTEVPLPVLITDPGERITVHVPVEGNPLRTTLPVDKAQVGWVIVPARGADGVTGWASITTLEEETDVHPVAPVTVKV